ncbi:MAG: ATP-binding cassette domain-containing protein, partial [Pedosphaera parvula]|nr:ATP-binding cassette domain-containing protein [Pedosphaera parvula]
EDTRARTEDNRLALIRRELAWFRRGAKARTTKQKARIGRLVDVQEEGPPPLHREFIFEIPEPGPLGKTILESRELGFRYGDRWLFKGFNLLMKKEMRVGILGPNGSGKTTLLRVLMGLEEATRGRIVRGDNVEFLYVDQGHEDVKPTETILDFVSGGAKYVEVNKKRIYIPAYLEKFLFDKNSVMMPVGNLSGGERNRLDMVKKLLHGGNFLVLDEPTNDLDLYTLRVLEETIEAFDGCALIVSHDRYFLNRLCTHMLIFEPEARIVQITGNYDDYLLYKERTLEEERQMASTPAPQQQLPRPEKPRRLTYLEKQELDAMEEHISVKEAELTALEAAIHAPGFYQQEHTLVQETLHQIELTKAATDTLYARWAELEALRLSG